MLRVSVFSLLASAMAVLSVAGCSPVANEKEELDLGIRWVRSAAEYEALSLQAYQAASDDLQKFVDDTSWSALPGQTDAAELPVAIIADVDETIVSNVEFQVVLVQPFSNSVMNSWNDANMSKPIPGAADFVRLAREAGVEMFFVTNRPCEKIDGSDDPCPQEAVTLQDLKETGVDADSDHLMLANESLGWDREKLSRREHIAKTHRVIMLLGDDLGDFIACSREKPLHPCSEGATIASRLAATNELSRYWGEGWYVLPNPMHGSWTSVN
jgi:5'-nucleotidase (lipoprotein e(P4) family)